MKSEVTAYLDNGYTSQWVYKDKEVELHPNLKNQYKRAVLEAELKDVPEDDDDTDDGENKLEDIAAAMALITERGDKADFTENGEIRKASLKKILGFSPTTKQVNAASVLED